MSYSKKDREYYNVHRGRTCDALGLTTNQYNELRRIGQALHQIYENQCNGYAYPNIHANGTWNVEAEEADQQREVKLMDKALKLADMHGLNIFFQTDPRGATIYADSVEVEEINASNYNRAYCIY